MDKSLQRLIAAAVAIAAAVFVVYMVVATPVCEVLGGTYIPNTEKCTFKSEEELDCLKSGGEWDSSTNYCSYGP